MKQHGDEEGLKMYPLQSFVTVHRQTDKQPIHWTDGFHSDQLSHD